MEFTKDLVFEEKLLKKLPLTYHYMVELKTDEVSELNHKKRFSASKKHYSNAYLNKENYKPISSILIDQ